MRAAPFRQGGHARIERVRERMPAEQRAFDPARIAPHRDEARELAEIRFVVLGLAGEDRAESLLERPRGVDVAADHGLGHHRRGCDADRAAVAVEADVADAAAFDAQLNFQIVAALRIVATRFVRRFGELAEAARRTLVLDDELLVERALRVGGDGGGFDRIHLNTFSACATPATRRSTSSCVL